MSKTTEKNYVLSEIPNFITNLNIIDIKSSIIKNWIQNETLENLPTIASRNLFKDKYGFNLSAGNHNDNLIPKNSYLILSCIKLNLFTKDLKSLFDSNISNNNEFGDFETIHQFLYDIVKETKEVFIENFEKVEKDYYEVLCLAINNDIELKQNWNLVLSVL